MPTITFLGTDHSLEVPRGAILLDACRLAGIEVPAACGGRGTCGQCRVRIVEGEVPPSTGHAHALTPAEQSAGWRLACRATVEGDLTIDASRHDAVRTEVVLDGLERTIELDPVIRAIPVEMSPPTLEDPMPDDMRLLGALGSDVAMTIAHPLLAELPGRFRACGYTGVALVRAGEVIGFDEAELPRLGLAVDVGTTTIAGSLVDLATGTTLAAAGRTNPQAQVGDDVVSRVGYAGRNRQARGELRDLVVGAMAEILAETCAAAGMRAERVFAVVAAGNTVMQHLLLGLDPAGIAASPFVAATLGAVSVPAQSLGLSAAPEAELTVLPCIGPYVGGDIVAGLLAHEVHRDERTVLFVDVGTNGEVVLRAGGTSYACSTAAGPAFEGARIGCGMRAATGAVSHVSAGEEDLCIRTVDDAAPRGLCGTGLLDAVATLLDLGLLDETGCFTDEDELPESVPPAIRARLQDDDSGPAFCLAPSCDHEPRVQVTQRDVRELQLAKGAVSAGIEVLFNHAGVKLAEVDDVLLAGGFGSRLSPASALRVGLLPPEIPLERVRAVGNTALAGARLYLLSRALFEEAETAARTAAHVELSGRMDFQMAFAEAMEFPDA